MPIWRKNALFILLGTQVCFITFWTYTHHESIHQPESQSYSRPAHQRLRTCASLPGGDDDASEQELFAAIELLRPTCVFRAFPSSRMRYVFIMSEPERHGRRYDLALLLAVASLMCTCPKHPVVVLWNLERITPVREQLQIMPGVEVRLVLPRLHDARRYHFLKLHIFNMTEYDAVAFFDSDMIFLGQPDDIFQICQSRLCAVNDPRTEWGASFNAGMLVVRPDKSWAIEVEQRWTGPYRNMFEQKALNSFLRAELISKHFNFFVSVMEDWQLLEATAWNSWPAVLHVKWWDLRRADMKMLMFNLCIGNLTVVISNSGSPMSATEA